MRLRRSGIVFSAVLLSAVSTRPYAQSLGEVAERESQRRQTVNRGKSYTNADLDAVDSQAEVELAHRAPTADPVRPDEPSVPKKIVTKGINGTVVEEDPKTGSVNIAAPPARNKRDEPYWRARAREVRERLAKAKSDLAATQARLGALNAESPTPATLRERDVTAKALARIETELTSANQDVARMQTAAEFGKVPPDWIK